MIKPLSELNTDNTNIFGYLVMRPVGGNENQFLMDNGEWTVYHSHAYIFSGYEQALESPHFKKAHGYGTPQVVELLGRVV